MADSEDKKKQIKRLMHYKYKQAMIIEQFVMKHQKDLL
jgi:hypothetical protein